jgi:hypothetical protein
LSRQPMACRSTKSFETVARTGDGVDNVCHYWGEALNDSYCDVVRVDRYRALSETCR